MDMTRREALGAAAVAGVCAPFLAACGAASTAGNAGGTGNTGSGGGNGSGGIKVPTSDVPVGGGVVTDGVVVTQPTAGEFKAFKAMCTHEQSPLTAVSDGQIICPRHGSRFSIADGSVEQGPAMESLTSDAVVVKNGTVTVTV